MLAARQRVATRTAHGRALGVMIRSQNMFPSPTSLAMSVAPRASRSPLAVAAVTLAMLCPLVGGAQAFAPALRVTEQQSGTTQLIQAVHAVNERVVWASGHGGVVLRTLDGGDHWSRITTPSGDTLEFRDVHAASADSAWILSAGAGTKSRIYHTTNGGASWTLQFTNRDTLAFYDCLTFLDAQRGIAFSDASAGRTLVLRTENAGASWSLLMPSAVPAPLVGEGAFASSGLCVAHSNATNVFIATGAPGARLFRSTDAGLTWRASETPFVRGNVAGLTGLAFRDSVHGIATAADISGLRTDTSSAVVGTTDDGGTTWTMRPRPPLPGALSGVAWVPGEGTQTAVVVGFGGAFVTSDGAKTWRTISDQIFTGVDAAGHRAWIAGGDGRITRLDW